VVPDGQHGQHGHDRNGGKRVHLRGHRRAQRETGERQVPQRAPAAPPHQPDAGEQESGRRHVVDGQGTVRDDVRREGIERQRHQAGARTGHVAGEREDHQSEQEREADDRKAGEQHEPFRIVARVVQKMSPDRAFLAVERLVEV